MMMKEYSIWCCVRRAELTPFPFLDELMILSAETVVPMCAHMINAMYKYRVCIIIFNSLAVDDASDARVAMVRKMTRAGCVRQRHEMPSLHIYGYLFSRVIRSFIIKVDDKLKKLKPCPKCRRILRSAAPP